MIMPATKFFDFYPELEKYWSVNNTEYTKDQLTKTVVRRLVLWTCDVGHEFSAYPVRVARSFGNSLRPRSSKPRRKGVRYTVSHCHVCNGSVLVVGSNDLLTQAPEIASMLVPGQVDPATIHKSSGKFFDWVCSKGHIRTAKVNDLFNGYGCGICSGREVEPGVTDLLTNFPEVAAELIGAGPYYISQFSSERHEWWCAKCDHTWEAVVSNRTFNKSGCPECSTPNTSKSEGFLIESLMSLFDSILGTGELNLWWGNGRRVYCDFVGTIGAHKVVIEYDGEYWHRRPERLSADLRKTQMLLDNGFLLIRYRESPLALLGMDHPNLLQVTGPHIKTQTSQPEIERWIIEQVSACS